MSHDDPCTSLYHGSVSDHIELDSLSSAKLTNASQQSQHSAQHDLTTTMKPEGSFPGG